LAARHAAGAAGTAGGATSGLRAGDTGGSKQQRSGKGQPQHLMMCHVCVLHGFWPGAVPGVLRGKRMSGAELALRPMNKT
jgi:hypothetical protein